MPIDATIFETRFRANDEICPTPQALKQFLASPKIEGWADLHAQDLATYRQHLAGVQSFEQRLMQGAKVQDIRLYLAYRVLGHTAFFNLRLLSAVEQYKYHLRALAAIDILQPMDFLRSAEAQMSKLDVKKINDVMRIARLQEMVAERKKILAELKTRWVLVSTELRLIARYISENLTKIEILCKASIQALTDREAAEKKEKLIVADIQSYVKERLKTALRGGQLTKQDLEKAKNEVDALVRELLALVREDRNGMTRMYEAIRDHVQESNAAVSVQLAVLEGKKTINVTENTASFTKIETALVRLLMKHAIEIEPTPVQPRKPHDGIMQEKRTEMAAYLTDLVRKERRTRDDRRSLRDRRVKQDPGYKGPERRKSTSRRSGKNRR